MISELQNENKNKFIIFHYTINLGDKKHVLCIPYITLITRPKVFKNGAPKKLFGPTRAKGAITHP